MGEERCNVMPARSLQYVHDGGCQCDGVDLVERLRAMAKRVKTEMYSMLQAGQLLDEAADEIERMSKAKRI